MNWSLVNIRNRLGIKMRKGSCFPQHWLLLSRELLWHLLSPETSWGYSSWLGDKMPFRAPVSLKKMLKKSVPSTLSYPCISEAPGTPCFALLLDCANGGCLCRSLEKWSLWTVWLFWTGSPVPVVMFTSLETQREVLEDIDTGKTSNWCPSTPESQTNSSFLPGSLHLQFSTEACLTEGMCFGNCSFIPIPSRTLF